ncbi:LLM class flavin-dependent oxidoreductase [Marisediminicola sp. LYQ134]|uniref:LLM class flavin-dependent oxidoreductase n=1 Tax=unclassified Marisediminicola TaxID=2618316 RepID=UPI003982E3F8
MTSSPLPPLSVLDLASIGEGMTHTDALAQTIETAKLADELGYGRFWVAEHHGMDAVASSAPAVLIAAIAAATTRIRVGSGGVMLPNHSSLVIAEQFGTLVALHGDRIDLGLGRAPGTDGLTARLLRRNVGAETVDDFPQQVVELLAFFGIIAPLESGVGSTVVAVPGQGDAPLMWLLGSSGYSAQLAGMLGLPFAFAHHFAGGVDTARAFELYRERFEPSAVLDAPLAMVSVSAIVADETALAHRLALPGNLWGLRLRSGGRPGRMPSLAEAEAHEWTDAELAFASDRDALQAIGTNAEVRARITELAEQTGANEVLVAPGGPDLDTKFRTLRDLAA